MATRSESGLAGEDAVKGALEDLGWVVEDLNRLRRNAPNVDLIARKGAHAVAIQVKAYSKYGWISGGGVNPDICSGASLFNRDLRSPERAEFVICPTPAERIPAFGMPQRWRFFVMPVDVADRLFRINVDAYFNGTNLNGTPRKQSGAVQDWVGPGPVNSKVVPDHQMDFRPFENAFHLLELAAGH